MNRRTALACLLGLPLGPATAQRRPEPEMVEVRETYFRDGTREIQYTVPCPKAMWPKGRWHQENLL